MTTADPHRDTPLPGHTIADEPDDPDADAGDEDSGEDAGDEDDELDRAGSIGAMPLARLERALTELRAALRGARGDDVRIVGDVADHLATAIDHLRERRQRDRLPDTARPEASSGGR
jgi:hypothetical protein